MQSHNGCQDEPLIAATCTPSRNWIAHPQRAPSQIHQQAVRPWQTVPVKPNPAVGELREARACPFVSGPARKENFLAVAPCALCSVELKSWEARAVLGRQSMAVHNSSVAWRKEQLFPAPWKEGSGAADDSLTSLQWLQEFSFLAADPERPPASSHPGGQRPLQGSDAPDSPSAGDSAAASFAVKAAKHPSRNPGSLRPLTPTQGTAEPRSSTWLKPPYSYATLICMAMQASKGAKLTLSAIYAWIMENFGYYRHAEPSWQNSIRHNLSLNKFFQKVPRRKDEPGKGGFWQINPHYADTVVGHVFRRRHLPAVPLPRGRSLQPLPACGTALGSRQRTGLGLLAGIERQHRESHQGPPGCSGRGLRTATAFPLATGSRGGAALPGELSWAPQLEDPFVGASSSLEDLELRAALGVLAAGEEAPSRPTPSQPPSPLDREEPSCPAAVPGDDLALGQSWEDVGADPALDPSWALEEGLLAEIQPWEGAGGRSPEQGAPAAVCCWPLCAITQHS